MIGYNIFTDGSKIADGVGCAFILFNNSTSIYKELYRLSNFSTVFLAEVMAIYKAIKYIKHTNLSNVTIFSDSLSAIQAISNCSTSNPLIFKIHEIINNLHNCKLCWIKAHVGHLGNEAADVLAKQASQLPNISISLKLDKVTFKKIAFKLYLNCWQELWNTSTNGRHTFQIFPKISTNRIFGNFFINQILSNHGFHAAHQHRLFQKSPVCICDHPYCDISHLIFNCSIFDDIRIKFFPLNSTNVSLSNLIHSPKSYNGLIEIIKSYCNIIRLI